MAKTEKRGFWRTCRIYFRRFRIAVLSVILILLCCLLYLNRIGLPDFIKRPLLTRLNHRGIDLQFERMRWRWNRGIVAEKVQFVRSDGTVAPRFTVKEAEVEIDYRALLRLQLQVRGLVLKDGELDWEISDTNAPSRKIALEKIQTELRLLPNDLWELNQFQAQFAGAKLNLGGVLTNASALRELRTTPRKPSEPGAVQRRLQQLADTLERIHFATPPELNLDVRGDVREIQSFTVRLNVSTPDADTPWGKVEDAFLTVVMLPGTSNIVSQVDLQLNAASAQTRWAGATNLNLNLHLISELPDTNLIGAQLELSAAALHTRWGSARNASINANWRHPMTNALPQTGSGSIAVSGFESPHGSAEQVKLTGSFEPAPLLETLDSSWGFWTNLAPYSLRWHSELSGIKSPKLNVDQFSCDASWDAPDLKLNHLAGTLYGGNVAADAAVDVATREFRFNGNSDFDAQKIGPLLTEKSRQWIQQFAWTVPPKLKASGAMTLPAWTNLSNADWRNEVRPTILLDGHFDVGEGSFRGVQFNAAQSHFGYSNLFWRLPDLVAHRTEGDLKLVHVSNEATRDYWFKIDSAIDLAALKPLLETKQQRIYTIIGLRQPPSIKGEIRGRWYDHDSIGAKIQIAATNFLIREESFDHATATIEYTNRYVRIIEPRASRAGGTQYGSATSVDIDIPNWKIYLTNANGVADPAVITRAVGPMVARHMDPYRFMNPVSATVNGVIPMRHEQDADLHFVLEGGPFEWWKFRLPHISGRIHWVGEHLELEGLHARFYRGTATGNATFDFREAGGGARFGFDVLANDADLHLLMSDLLPRTNRLEGRLSGRLTVTDASSTNLHSIQGSGRFELRDGLIWDIPLFGVLSPVLDGIVPGMGLGSSRAREARANFVITNGVMHSDNLEIGASMMRLQYSGTVDIATGEVDARAQAELLRDTPAVGRLLSLTLWPGTKVFEYRFTGTLGEPKSEPVYFVPKVLLLPFQPFRYLKEIAPDLPPPGNTSPSQQPNP